MRHITAATSWGPAPSGLTSGLDVGDRSTSVCVVDGTGQVVERAQMGTTRAALARRFAGTPRQRIVLESGTHSPWMDRALRGWGHETIVANARRLQLISANATKRDAVDAELLARVGRVDPQLLAPITHRAERTHRDLTLLRARDVLVRSRTRVISAVRGMVKSVGERVPNASADSFARQATPALPPLLAPVLTPLLAQIQGLTQQIRAYNKELAALAQTTYPATQRLRQVTGVGPVTALAYVLVLEDPTRFANGRCVGAYLGLTPGRNQSGLSDPQQHITKRGDALLRRLLVGSAQYILGPFGPDCELRRWGLALATRGGRNAKKRAVVAVARKLAGLLHALWTSGAIYMPVRQAHT